MRSKNSMRDEWNGMYKLLPINANYTLQPKSMIALKLITDA